MDRVEVAPGGKGFVLRPSGRPYVPWGFNYDHDQDGRLLEDYWESEWDRVVTDFREMKALGATAVRIHLQFARFMSGPETPNGASLDRMGKLLGLAEETGLYLDLTGLGSYRRDDTPSWYVKAGEGERWAMQARFWEAVAGRCAGSPAVFCYTLMNEPISPAGPKDELWGGTLGGYQYVELLTRDPAGRDRHEVTRQWMEILIAGIRKRDRSRPVTVGSFFLFDRIGSLTLGPDPKKVAAPLDFQCVHLYPKEGKADEAIALLQSLEAVGKPVVIEEMFPLSCGVPTFRKFLDASRGHASGWIGFYWGKAPPQNPRPPMHDAIIAEWLALFRELGPSFRTP